MTSEEQMAVLRMVQKGIISAEEGERLLQALSATADDKPPVADPGPEAEESPETATGVGSSAVTALPAPAASADWRMELDRYPLVAGSALAALGATVLAVGYATGRHRWSFLGGYLPLSIGLLFVAGGVWLARAVWVRVRISDARNGRPRVVIAVPVPLSLAAWAVRFAQPFVKEFDMTGLDETILSLQHEIRSGQALSIDVSENEDGERIQVSIG